VYGSKQRSTRNFLGQGTLEVSDSLYTKISGLGSGYLRRGSYLTPSCGLVALETRLWGPLKAGYFIGAFWMIVLAAWEDLQVLVVHVVPPKVPLDKHLESRCFPESYSEKVATLENYGSITRGVL
jgi:hypothetical protein